MKFELKSLEDSLPDLEYGNRGEELSCFVPSGYSWTQIGYGQGEGQVLINGCEWGFYYVDDNTVFIVLHEGSMLIEDAVAFINKVRNKIFGNSSSKVELRITGTGNT